MDVSVVIPAYEAAGTIGETIESLLAQTWPNWEAIVVDDGSSDETAAIAQSLADRDARIRVVSQPHAGVSATRNRGISLASFDWLVFLDADDWLLPPHLEQMTGALAKDSGLDAVYCRWARITPGGESRTEQLFNQTGDLFDGFASSCDLAIHACLVRRSLVESIGGFDPALRTCEDWDFWQRIARTGAHFGPVPEVLACYRMRPDSASLDSRRLLEDGLRVICQGHAFDPRVPNPHPAHVNGRPVEHLSEAKYRLACWIAGLELGRGRDARPLLQALETERAPALQYRHVAHTLFLATRLPACHAAADWLRLWPDVEPRMTEFLQALEAQALAPGLAHSARLLLERLILQHTTPSGPLTIGLSHHVSIEVTEPIPDLRLSASVERLHCAVTLEGEALGALELPVCDALVPAHVLADALAAQFAWRIIGHFFERTVYPNLSLQGEPGNTSVWRGDLCLAAELSAQDETFWAETHKRIGWTVFLQEIWGRPDWLGKRFYDREAASEGAPCRRVDHGWLALEVSDPLPVLEVSTPEIDILLLVGGVALGIVTLQAKENLVRAQELRAALTRASGYELCCAAVREGLLGKPMTDTTPLRARLAQAASEAAQLPGWPAAYGSSRALGSWLSPDEHSLVLGRRHTHAFGTSSSRRAMLPAAAIRSLLEAAAVTGEPIVTVPAPGREPKHVMYAPDVIYRPAWRSSAWANGQHASGGDQTRQAGAYGRRHFETLFATRPDPWNYTNAYEQTKYEQTLALLPATRMRRGLELACAEGHFTAQLAPRVDSLVAADISQIALDRAAERCADLPNVHFARLDMAQDPLPGRFDLIVCSEVLYFMGDVATLRAVADKFAAALEPGGYLLTAHANLVVDEPDQPGFDWDFPFGSKVIGEVLAEEPSLHLVSELRTPLYRVQLFRRDPRLRRPFQRRAPRVVGLTEQPAPLPPDVAAHALWHGGSPKRNRSGSAVVTDRLPILMYHQVAPEGSPAMARYRVTPRAFEEQLRYLRDTGFYSIRLEDWYAAVEAKRPLPGRALLLTFDDGYRDLLTYAWPVLKQYGFSATVFLVADAVGKSNHWDQVYSEEALLLSWQEIRQLQAEGVAFGSHTASHRRLTALSPAEIACEAARSRAVLEWELKAAVHALAYPHGDMDPAVEHLVGACGYAIGLTCQPGLCTLRGDLLALPRLEVAGSDSFSDFVAKLSPGGAAGL